MTGSDPPKVPATAKGEATRAFLLRTAAQVFAERGYAATTQNDLIAASGLTKGAFYFYFRTKSELALAVLQDQQARWLSQIGERVLAEAKAADQLRVLVPAMLELISTDPGAWSVTRLTKELSADPEVAEQVCKPMVEWVAFVADLVRRGQTDGDLRTGLDPGSVAAVLVGAFDGLKSLTDILEPTERAAFGFTERVQTLLAIVELALMNSPAPTGSGGDVR
ncbi:TetR/AcrR family transcriptional regulator [Candidatus Protofrankia californiensis]|uniref:TetR/AcrR family transcriptional regulator n=1 Tax=Candidatus Protofrankia californiensis TaxID=1839754 RepID=UPI001F4950BF|nr:TetR/AcrR family transcriptional regulator [Candidatus Protofrankia californiensis]